MKILILSISIIFLSCPTWAQTTIELNSGEKIFGSIVDENKDFIKIKKYGIILTYWKDSISKILRHGQRNKTLVSLESQSVYNYKNQLEIIAFISSIFRRVETDQLNRQMAYSLSKKLFSAVEASINTKKYNADQLNKILEELQVLKSSTKNCKDFFNNNNIDLKRAINSIDQQELQNIDFLSLFSIASIADASNETGLFELEEITDLNRIISQDFFQRFKLVFNALSDQYHYNAFNACIKRDPQLVTQADDRFYYDNPQLLRPVTHIKRILKKNPNDKVKQLADHMAKIYFLISTREDMMIIINNHNSFYSKLTDLIDRINNEIY